MFSEERRWELACGAVLDAATASYIPRDVLLTAPSGDPFEGSTLQETLADSLMEQDHLSPLDELWTNSLSPERATQGIFRLTLLQENLLIFIGLGPSGEESVTILGELPFSAPLLPRDRYAYPPQEISELHEDDAWIIEGLDEPHPD